MEKRVFDRPECEVVRFENKIITASGCGCYDEMFPVTTGDCLRDKPAACTCQVNHVAGTANCTPCAAYE